ncbi:hypothetical protein QZH41_006339 [Actinostola sp. cb2023]|nr:hypothetical protein QZH41_006339 [Actinostola sp. cb2023]
MADCSITEEKLSNFQIKREEEIRREGQIKLREIKLREEGIKKEAQERLERYKRREQQIKEEAEKRLLEEGAELQKIKREAERQLKEEREHEEKLKRSLEEDIRLEREKGEYIRREAERLLREDKFLSYPQPKPNLRTEFLIQSPQGRAYDQVTDQSHYNQNARYAKDLDDKMNPSRSKKMEYDPETGCYRRIVPLDFAEQKVEDIVKTEMNKAEVKMKLRSDKPAWKQAEDKEHGSNPDSSLEDLTLEASANEAETTPHYISGDSIKTEYKFTMKEEIQTESSPGGEEKNGEFADEEIRKAGEAIKAKFDEDRMKFEHDSGDITMSEREMTKRSYERRRRSSEDDPDRKKAREDAKERSLSLEKKIKDMEERRARMLRRSSGDHGDNDDSIKITRTITTETSHDKGNEATGSTRDESRSRRARMREERNRRRLASEGFVTETKSDDQSKATPMKSAGVKLELRSSSESYPGHSDASDITFTVKDPAEKKRESDSGEEKITSYTKTTKTVSLSGSLLDEPNVQSHTQPDDITFTVKESAHKKDVGDGEKATAEKSPRRDRVQEEEVKIEETEPVHSRFSGDFTQEEPDDIVFTVKKTTTTTAITSAVDSNKPEEPPKSVTREITLEERSFNPKTDLISWEEDIIDSGDKPLFRDYEPRKKREQVIADSSEYRGSLGRTELNRDHKRRRNLEHISGDSTDGYRGSLGRTDLNRVGSSSKGRNDLPPVILHDIESDFHEEQFVEPQKQMQVESAAPATSPMEEFEAPILYPHYQDKSLDDERRKRQLEIEEKQRQIMEKQQRASVKRREIPGTNKKTEDSPVPASSDNTEDLQEKRRSLLMMWESFAEGDGAGPENKLDEEQRRTSFGYEKMMTEASQSDPKALNSAGVVDYRIMDVEEENEEQRTPSVDIDEHHKLNDDELKWERAGQFQPGRLKTKFHELNEDDEPSADNIVFETKKTGQGSNNNTDESSSSYSIEQRYSYQAPIEEDQSKNSIVMSVCEIVSCKPLWDNVEDQSTHKDDDDNDEVVRRPHVDVDKENRLTEEEARWERAGHFQPGKINTSIFEARKTADQTERVGSQKFKKSETRSYEQIKKIQRTDSKKEMLVPKKVTLRASDDDVSDVMEQDEYERPEVGKIDKSSLVYETMSDEERQRRERDERNRREMEEIQREREEERRRLEREDREAVTTINDFEDDEFDAKVKAKNVRKIDISKFGDFQKSPESVQENRPVSKLSTKRYSSEKIESHQTETVESTPTAPEEDDFELKVRHRMVGKLNIDSSPFKQHEASVKETSQPRKVQDQTCTYNEDIVVKEIPMEESAPPMEFENEEHNGRARSIRKLDKSRFSFSSDDKRSSPDQRPKDDLKSSKMNDLDKTPVTDDRKKKREREMREWEEDLKRDREQIDYVMKVHDNTFQSGLEGGSDIVTNDFENETRNIRKLDLSLFSKFKQEKDEPEAPVRKPSLKKEETYNTEEVVTIQSVKEVESIPDERSPEEDYELKRRSVGKLNMDWMSQMSQQDTKDSEQRRKETEMQRVKQEQYEIEKLRMEEMERGQMEGDDVWKRCNRRA